MATEDSSVSPVLIAVFLIIVTVVLFLLKKVLKKNRRYILLTGLNESGKTLIYSHLFHNKHVITYTSSLDNVDEYKSEGKEVIIADLPGFHSIRQQFFEKYKDSSKGIIYVVDSVTVPKNIRDAANVLYNILVDPVIMKNKPNILILCNKQDQTLAKGSNAIKSMLEKELNTLCNTQLNQLKELDSKENTTRILGDPSKDFNFSSLYCRVDFAESCAYNKNGSVNLDELKKWIKKIA